MVTTLTSIIIDGIAGTLDTEAVDRIPSDIRVAYRTTPFFGETWEQAARRFIRTKAERSREDDHEITTHVKDENGYFLPRHFAQYGMRNTLWVYRAEPFQFAPETSWQMVPVGKFRRAKA